MKKISDKSHLSLHTQKLYYAHAPLPWARSSKRRRREGPAPHPSPSSGLDLRSIRTCCRSCSMCPFQADTAVNADTTVQSQKMTPFFTVAAINLISVQFSLSFYVSCHRHWMLFTSRLCFSLSVAVPAATAESPVPVSLLFSQSCLSPLSQLNPLHQSSSLFSLSWCASCLYQSSLLLTLSCCQLSQKNPLHQSCLLLTLRSCQLLL